MRKKIGRWQVLLLLFLLGSISLSQAQEITVSGVITDKDDGLTLIGVSVIQKGTSIGTTTDLDGNYTITIQKDSTLVFSYVGYDNQEAVASSTTIDIALVAKSELLEEVIIIGYGTQKKTDKTGAVSHVTADELGQGAITDPIQALQGKAAGVSITKKGGDPNAGFAIRIRGSAGFLAGTEPLIVVDGVPDVDLTMIAPEDIESYNILKDAASTAIYGSRGANGVIIVTTKSASKKYGKTYSQVNFNSKYSLSTVDNTVDMLSASELRGFADTRLQDALPQHPNWTIDSIYKDGGASTNWQDEIYRVGVTTDNNLSFSGGSDAGSYRASITHTTWEGVMKGTEKERTNAKINLTHKAFNDHLTLSANMATAFENNDYENYGGWGKDDIIYQALSHNPTDPVYLPNGDYDKTQREYNYENPLATINEVTNARDAKKFLGNLKADVKILEGFNANVSVSYLRDDAEYSYFRPSGLYASADNGFGRRSYENSTDKSIEAFLTYIKTFNDKHNFNFMGGYSWREKMYDGFYSQARNSQSPSVGADNLQTFVDVTYGDIGSHRSAKKLIGFFGRVQYNYQSKYYFAASLRRDGSTVFGENNKWGWFPTASLSWNMQNESFLKDVSWLDQLRLRASYGISGNDNIGIGHSQVAWVPNGVAINPETGEEVVAFRPAWNENPDLKWEKTTETNLGIDFAFLKSRISGSIELYFKETTDLLGAYSVPVPPNLAPTTYANSGTIENKGIELYLQAFVVDKTNISYKTSITVSHNKSEWTDLGSYNGNENVVKYGHISGRGMVGEEYYVTGVYVGQEVGAFYLPEYITMQDGAFIYASESGGYTTKLADAKRSFVGTPNPDIEFGWSNNFTFYKNWTLDFAFRSMIGNKKYNATRMFFDVPGNMPSLNGTQDAIDWYEEGRTVTGATIADFYLEDASFIKLDYISLGYNLNTKNIKWLSGLKIFAVANNLLTITSYSGADPETYMQGLSYGIDQYNLYPKTKTITFGINATF